MAGQDNRRSIPAPQQELTARRKDHAAEKGPVFLPLTLAISYHHARMVFMKQLLQVSQPARLDLAIVVLT
jgi:hypothetical protein